MRFGAKPPGGRFGDQRTIMKKMPKQKMTASAARMSDVRPFSVRSDLRLIMAANV
jgi:hypothetical protein